jgi:hypothetical protein
MPRSLKYTSVYGTSTYVNNAPALPLLFLLGLRARFPGLLLLLLLLALPLVRPLPPLLRRLACLWLAAFIVAVRGLRPVLPPTAARTSLAGTFLRAHTRTYNDSGTSDQQW